MIIYKQELELPKNNIQEKLEGLNGKQCYEQFKFGIDDCVSETVTFENGYQADIKMCVCDEEYTCFAEVVLFDQNGNEICCSECADSVIGEWDLWAFDDLYQIEVTVGDN